MKSFSLVCQWWDQGADSGHFRPERDFSTRDLQGRFISLIVVFRCQSQGRTFISFLCHSYSRSLSFLSPRTRSHVLNHHCVITAVSSLSYWCPKVFTFSPHQIQRHSQPMLASSLLVSSSSSSPSSSSIADLFHIFSFSASFAFSSSFVHLIRSFASRFFFTIFFSLFSFFVFLSYQI